MAAATACRPLMMMTTAKKQAVCTGSGTPVVRGHAHSFAPLNTGQAHAHGVNYDAAMECVDSGKKDRQRMQLGFVIHTWYWTKRKRRQ
jgi:hypothetical protein